MKTDLSQTTLGVSNTWAACGRPHLLIYSLEQSPSREANWFSAS